MDYYLYELNQDQVRRDEILKKYCKELDQTEGEDVHSFSQLSIKGLNLLISENFIPMDERQNKSPSFRTIADFVNKYPRFKVSGYAVDLSRSDYRISIDKIQVRGHYLEAWHEFSKLFAEADDLYGDSRIQYAWYD